MFKRRIWLDVELSRKLQDTQLNWACASANLTRGQWTSRLVVDSNNSQKSV